MEEDSYRNLKSPVLSKPDIQKELEALKMAADESQKRIDFTSANDPEIQRAIRVVERFLRKKKRVCYGGTAINELLPSSLQFYDKKYQIPDYDMFSPDVKGDVAYLVEELKKEGFEDINEKVGIHEGTQKVLVNFIPIADLTEMNETLYRVILRRSVSKDGIHFCDPDFLRMMMYLELSRPRGQVERWEKVYERLSLLEKVHPMRSCRQSVMLPVIDSTVHEKILSTIIKRKRVIAGFDAIEYYNSGKELLDFNELLEKEGVVVFFSPEAQHDAEDLVDIIGHGVKVDSIKALADSFYDVHMVRYNRKPVCLIVQETSCHGYTKVNLQGGNSIRIASLDTLMNLYLSFVVFGKKEERFLQTPVLCLVDMVYKNLKKYRSHPKRHIPPFTVLCSGREKGYATLQKERVERQKKIKKGGGRSTRRSLRRGGRGRLTRKL